MDDFEAFRDDLVFAFLLIASAMHSKNPEDQYQTARDFRDAMDKGDFSFVPDEGLRTQLAKTLRQDKSKWTDK